MRLADLETRTIIGSKHANSSAIEINLHILSDPQSVTLRVPIDQVTYACHDPEDTSVFAVIVRTEQQKSFSGLRLHAFQAEQKTVS